MSRPDSAQWIAAKAHGDRAELATVIHIPQCLADNLAASDLRIDVRDSLAVITWLIASRSRGKTFCNISHALMGQYVRYPSILKLKEQLVKWRVIGCDGRYSSRPPNAKSYGYRIAKEATESEVIPYDISSLPCLKRMRGRPQK